MLADRHTDAHRAFYSKGNKADCPINEPSGGKSFPKDNDLR